MSRPARVASLLTLGVLLVQAAWVLALPPFRGIDEFDHAYRAAAVVRGQLVPSDTKVAHGRGDYLVVPRTLVEAARPVCASYTYTGSDNCRGAADAGNGRVEVASGAARYNPVFYWIIGKPAQLLDGNANVYALRILASLLCAGLIWIATYAVIVGHRTAWPLLGLLAGMTPVFLYSTSLGAPNGVEMTAALALWAALLSLRGQPLDRAQERLLLLTAGGAAVALSIPRLLGPAWLLLIIGAAMCFLGTARVRELAATHRRLLAGLAALVLAALVSAVAWDRLAAPNSLARERDLGLGNPVGRALDDIPVWILQSMAAFPTRNEPAPAVVYAAALLAIVAVLAAAGARLGWQWWMALGALVVVWLGAQLAVAVPTYSHLGSVWQGRYALPFGVGIPLVLTSLSERKRQRLPHRLLLSGVVLVVVLAHAVSIVNVFLDESASSPLAGSATWVRVPAWALTALLVAVAPLWWSAARSANALEPPILRAQPCPLQEAAVP